MAKKTTTELQAIIDALQAENDANAKANADRQAREQINAENEARAEVREFKDIATKAHNKRMMHSTEDYDNSLVGTETDDTLDAMDRYYGNIEQRSIQAARAQLEYSINQANEANFTNKRSQTKLTF